MAFTITDTPLDFPLPAWRRVRQLVRAARERSIGGAVAREMTRLDGRLRPGMRVAVGVGSRGLARLAEIVRAVVDELKRRDVRPFIVPAMGSHGGATAQGQIDVLATYGVTEAAMGVPIDASMETVQVGTTPAGFPVHFGRAALAADALLAVNRVKPHTSFRGPVESGLAKMLVIGFAKHTGAVEIHRQGFDVFHEVVPAALRVVLAKVPVLGGLASIENASEEVAELEVVPAEAIPTREPELLARSRALMARIPFERLDVLVVDYLGKDISGAGLDPNVTLRYGVRHIGDQGGPQRLVVLRLTERTRGNACGIGVADLTTRDVVDAIDYQKTWTNVVTATELDEAKTPIWLPSDREAIALAIQTCNRVDRAAPRLVRIASTLHLEELWVSEALWQAEGHGRDDLEPLGEPEAPAFTADGRLVDLPPTVRGHGRSPWTDPSEGAPA